MIFSHTQHVKDMNFFMYCSAMVLSTMDSYIYDTSQHLCQVELLRIKQRSFVIPCQCSKGLFTLDAHSIGIGIRFVSMRIDRVHIVLLKFALALIVHVINIAGATCQNSKFHGRFSR